MKAARVALALVLLASGLLGAATPSGPPPVVVVYPLTVGGDTEREAGGRIGVLYATRLAELGGITVKPPTPGTARAQFLERARGQSADYYVTGFLTPLGNDVSVVNQIVSTASGIVVWSDTVQIRTYAEAAGQAELIRAAILRHAGRSLAALDAVAAPTGAPSAQPSGKNDSNISGLFRGRKRPGPNSSAPTPSGQTPGAPTSAQPKAVAATAQPKAAAATTQPKTVTATTQPKTVAAVTERPAAPPPTASRPVVLSPTSAPPTTRPTPAGSPVSALPPTTPAAALPAASTPAAIAVIPVAGAASLDVTVVPIVGDAPAASQTYAAQAIVAELNRAGRSAALATGGSSSDLPAKAESTCAANHANAIAAGTLALQRIEFGFVHATSADFELSIYDCAGKLLARQRSQTQVNGRNGELTAIDRATSQALDVYLKPTPAPRRRR